ncbi:MAG: sporulation protein YqfD [Defluviitaleaceae bacterium]|nr:sporulation protein YqfD [Defluviitaleaceae bacterium]
MLITLWNYIRGYVIIEVTGRGALRFLNIAARGGTYIWDVVQTDRGLSLKVSVAAFWGLRKHARKAGCKFRITSRTGAPFVVHRYRKRKLLVAGALMFVISLYAMSMFVWQIEIIGTGRLNPADVTAAAAQAGLDISSFRPGIDRDRIENHLLTSFEDIAWVNVSLRGTRATINLTETLPRQIIVDRRSPADVVAAKDGLIVSIVTSSGTPRVRVHDVVRAGDVLVSSEIIVREDEAERITDYVHADAQVLARIYYDFNFAVPYVYNIRNYTGNEHTSYDIILFGRSFALPFRSHGFESFTRSTSTENVSIGRYYPLPIIVESNTYREFVLTQHQRSPDESKALAETILESRITAIIDPCAEIIDKRIDFLEHSPSALIVRAVVAALEDIGQQQLAVWQ